MLGGVIGRAAVRGVTAGLLGLAIGVSSLIVCQAAAERRAAVATATGEERESRWRFRWSEAGRGLAETGMTAVAFDAQQGWLASGDENGVRLIRVGAGASGPLPATTRDDDPTRAGAPVDRKLRVSGVTDLLFDREGRLLIASARGFYRAAPGGDLVDHTPGVGRDARHVSRIATQQDRVLVATHAGAFVAAAERGWRRLDAGFPSGPVSAVAMTPRQSDGSSLALALVAGALWGVPLQPGKDGDLELSSARELRLPQSPGAGIPVDLVADLPGAERQIAVVYSEQLLLGTPGGASEGSDWRQLRPVLPPGARIRRLGHAANALWLATDRGLLTAAHIAGPWRRTMGAASRADVMALSGDSRRVFAAARRGLVVGERDLPRPGASTPLPASWPEDALEPGIRSVQRAALDHLALGMGELREARRGLSRRGWMPTLGLRFDVDRDHARSSVRDQVFTSGALRHLQDRDSDDSIDLGASLSLAWDLGDTAFDDRWIDLSREGRLLAALRDDVLDELNQLYFERLGLLTRRRVHGASEVVKSEDEGQQLDLRIAELTAGLDAWTGGWFSSQLDRDSRASRSRYSPRAFEERP